MSAAAAVSVRAPAAGRFVASYSSLGSVTRPTPLKPSRSARHSVLFSRSDAEGAPRTRVLEGSRRLLYKCTQESYFAVRVPLLRAGFKRVPKESVQQCNVVWRRPFTLSTSERQPHEEEAEPDSILSELFPARREQRVNHFPSSYLHLGCKDGLSRCLDFMRARWGSDYGFAPRTWVLPEEHDSLRETLEGQSRTSLIAKPARGSCGRDIFVIADPNDARLQRLLSFATAPPPAPADSLRGMRRRRWVVQKYIDPPMLLDGRKFDLRLYVAVTSVNPLVAYVYREGLVRFATETYSSGESATRFASLTNSSVARKRDAQLRKVGAEEEAEPVVAAVEPASSPPHVAGPLEQWQARSRDASEPDEADPSWPRFKWTLTELRHWIEQKHGSERWDEVWESMCTVITRTLIAAERPISEHLAQHASGELYRERGFEHFGFDIMFSDDLTPHLIEVNCIPSLESSSAMDYSVKCGAMTDMLNMLQIEPFERDVADMRLRADVDEKRAARRAAEKQLEQAELISDADSAEPQPLGEPLAELRRRLEETRREEAAAAERLRTELPFAPDPASEWRADEAAEKVLSEEAFSGGFQRIFPTPRSVEQCARYFEGSPSEERNQKLWASLRMA